VEIFLTFFIGARQASVIIFGILLLFLFVRPQGIMGHFVEEKV